MSEGPDSFAAPTPAPEPPATAGMLLRRAREKQGLHIAVLATQIKVSPRKLEALEADRHAELPDATFSRALAQAVCRTLKIDPAPVLALMPQAGSHRLEQVSEGINTPFRDDSRANVGADWSGLLRPALVVPVLVIAAALAVYLVPAGLLTSISATGPAPAASAAVAAPIGAASAAAAAPSAPGVVAPVLAEAVPQAVTPATTLQVRATAPSWVEVVDAGGQSLISRIVSAGETVDLDGALPMKLRIGNAGATQLSFRGQPVDLATYTRENVARFELK